MKSARIRLPSPEALKCPLAGENEAIRHHLEVLARNQLSDLDQLALLGLPEKAPQKTDSAVAEKLGVEKFDMYDEYFDVERTSQNPADELSSAFIASLVEVGEEAKRGHSLDPLALNAFLRAVQVQAQVLLKEAYDG
ncbi:hypothetical protein [Sagittula salina]|uniref:Uncharacterized protein n=1 Tax=Sagittula salina TaxID=2820268 RepID=A0A940S4J4_9RHOB|nr:hypothetical protein [Sagittula salina]MBP0484174.1 hypothetical protein [Sagittula salina]